MRILNLGAGGFIGAHLTQRLLDRGHTVVGVDTHDDKLLELLDHDSFTFLERDIRDSRYDLSASVREADLVIDLIAHANPGIYVRRPLDVFYLNFGENLRIAEACVCHRKRLIQFSSCEVYGKTAAAAFPDAISDPEDPALATFSEETTDFILGPVGKHRWIYACAKQLLERVIHAYGISAGLQYTIIRPFNFIGPKIDYLPSAGGEVPRVFSYFMEALILGTRMVLVDGGTHRRCYTYIDDAIDCVDRIIENPGGVCDGQIFNIGSPHNEISIRALAETMLRIYQSEFRIPSVPLPRIVEATGEEFYGAGYEDSDRRIPDITKARTLLGWEPAVGITELLTRTMQYYVRACREVKPADSLSPGATLIPAQTDCGRDYSERKS
jgi:nucleoside-diphosphate-sugar epimerase